MDKNIVTNGADATQHAIHVTGWLVAGVATAMFVIPFVLKWLGWL